MITFIVFPAYWLVLGFIFGCVAVAQGIKAMFFEICVLLAIIGLIRMLFEWYSTYNEEIKYRDVSLARKILSFCLQIFKSVMCTCLTISYFSALDYILNKSLEQMILGIIGFIVCLIIFVPDYALTAIKKDGSLTGRNVCDFLDGAISGIIFVVGHGNW